MGVCCSRRDASYIERPEISNLEFTNHHLKAKNSSKGEICRVKSLNDQKFSTSFNNLTIFKPKIQ